MMRPKIIIFVTILTATLLLLWYIKSMAAPVYYSCTQARAAGHFNIKQGDPLYRSELDRDKDGYACEV